MLYSVKHFVSNAVAPKWRTSGAVA